jgi:hypothetical protein
MSDRVRFAISVTPIEGLTDENGGTHDVISGEVNKSLGGDGEVKISNYAGTAANQGFLNGAAYYKEAIDSADTVSISSETTASFVFIKNTGRKFESTSTLGDALSKAIKVMVGTTAVSILEPGECIVLKDVNMGINASTIYVRTVDLDGGNNTSAGHLAVEYLVVD